MGGHHVAERSADVVKLSRQRQTEHQQRGQGLVEFALVIPMIVILFMGILEVALMFNAFSGVNRASQYAAHVAATLGNQAGADCLILSGIEADVTVPNDPGRIIGRDHRAHGHGRQPVLWAAALDARRPHDVHAA